MVNVKTSKHLFRKICVPELSILLRCCWGEAQKENEQKENRKHSQIGFKRQTFKGKIYDPFFPRRLSFLIFFPLFSVHFRSRFLTRKKREAGKTSKQQGQMMTSAQTFVRLIVASAIIAVLCSSAEGQILNRRLTQRQRQQPPVTKPSEVEQALDSQQQLLPPVYHAVLHLRFSPFQLIWWRTQVPNLLFCFCISAFSSFRTWLKTLPSLLLVKCR